MGAVDNMTNEERNAVLEEAALVCERVVEDFRGSTAEWTAARARDAIRALKTQPHIPEEMLAIIRDPRIPLHGEEGAANIVLARGCKACLRAEHPYWHQAGTPCPLGPLT
jgi:hypothetical protein